MAPACAPLCCAECVNPFFVGTAAHRSPHVLASSQPSLSLSLFRAVAASRHARNAMAAADPHRITHVLFDMDGLLLDTETFYTLAQQRVLDRVKPGTLFTWELKARQMGMKALASAQLLVDELQLGGLVTAEEFLAQREAELDALFPTAQLMPGAEALVRHLHACGVPIAVATSSHRAHFDVKTQGHKEFFGLFDAVVTGDMVAKGKPDPEIFQAAAATFAQPPAAPARVLVFEDAPSGVAAALAAGMAVVMVPDANLDAGLVSQLGATAVLGSLCEFVPERWGLPPFGASAAAGGGGRQQLPN